MQNNLVKACSNTNGNAVVIVFIASLVTFTSVFAFFNSSRNTLESQMGEYDKFVAQQSASELLEFFKSLSKAQLTSYLSIHPISRSIGTKYKLCTTMKGGDKSGTDPIAALPTNLSNDAELRLSNVTRYYFVQVVKRNSLALVSEACGMPLGSSAGEYKLQADEGFLVKVGLSYTSRYTHRVEKVELSALVQDTEYAMAN